MIAWLVIGLILAFSLLVLLNWWANADVETAKRSLFWAIVGLCALFGVVMLAAGKGFLAVIPAGFAAWRMFGTKASERLKSKSEGRARSSGGMTRQEALDVLGLEDGASEQEINQAYRKLMAQCHPDKGGNDYLAGKLNEAKQTLLGR
ncbi:DnaJ domain-containing protein [Kordiimonas lipolytica]|uniref:DnaJ domain-containing protein n=1 Tax=Kordiimonas lipolytica TaxID=1662421 RepID=A0ABV8UGS5_9PROT|nr:DnaJ domain-containing protein [Kordiimonas lipolytica]